MKTMRAVGLFALLATLGFFAPQAKSCLTPFPEVVDLPVRPDMPDVMTMTDGTKVTTVEQWRQRREEMKEILEHYELGHAPPAPGNVSGADLQSHPVLGGAANYRLVHLKFGPEEKLGLDIAIFTPNGDVLFSDLYQSFIFHDTGGEFYEPPDAGRNACEQYGETTVRPRFNFSAPVDRHRAAARFTNLFGSRLCHRDLSLHAMRRGQSQFPHQSFYPAYPGYDWGVLLGWAWGLSRVVDYLETQPFADTNKLIALGHSRLGKLTMVATAFDERISLGAPAGSSGAGTGAYRFCGPGRGGKEGVEDMTRKFGYYFVPRLAEFTGQMQKLPFDAHWYIALTAPRPWISVEGTDDQNCVPNAVKQSVLAAQPVYQFLGVSTDRVGVNYEVHRHALTPEDWNAALDFADQQLRGIDHHRTFDHFPAEQTSTNSVAPK